MSESDFTKTQSRGSGAFVLIQRPTHHCQTRAALREVEVQMRRDQALGTHLARRESQHLLSPRSPTDVKTNTQPDKFDEPHRSRRDKAFQILEFVAEQDAHEREHLGPKLSTLAYNEQHQVGDQRFFLERRRQLVEEYGTALRALRTTVCTSTGRDTARIKSWEREL